jgi:hypothetical protein
MGSDLQKSVECSCVTTASLYVDGGTFFVVFLAAKGL